MNSPTRYLLCLGVAGFSIINAVLNLTTRNMMEARAQHAEIHAPPAVLGGIAHAKNEMPVAVIELFTSEGCSSCPPADANLRRLATMEATANGTVIPLSFHVDYWNYLGWSDPFSQSAFSERQREYAGGSHQPSVYTPQMIVNGRDALNGSDVALSDRSIQAALRRPVTHTVELTIAKSTHADGLMAHYVTRRVGADSSGGLRASSPRRDPASGDTATQAGTEYQINIAVATDAESVTVVGGENGGRALSHVWVVKQFGTQPLSGRGHAFAIDAGNVVPGHTRVVAYVQSRRSREITGAVSVEL